MLRTHTCGELRANHIGQSVTLCGWVAKVRDKGGMIWLDLRDRYGITQLILEEGKASAASIEAARKAGREFVLKATGTVVERLAKNAKMLTGDVEIKIESIEILNPAKIPPFLIEDETDGGDELRMKYRYLDLRREPVRQNLLLRHNVSKETRNYLDGLGFIDVETPVLIKSTPEGARDFVVPSRMNPGQFYALPQSPQTFKQLLMVSGFDRYFQIVKCFRDEDLRADRQPEFTQIDCEMSFVTREDILEVFGGLTKHLFKKVKGIDLPEIKRMSYDDAMKYYGCDKPDIRFDMKFVELTDLAQGKGFPVFDSAELVVGIVAEKCAGYTRKEVDELTDFVKRPQVGAKGMVYVRYNEDGTLKSSVDKFYNEEQLKEWAVRFGAKPGDLMLILSGEAHKTRAQLNNLRLEMGTRLGLRDKDKYEVLWVLDFPLLEYNEDEKRWFAMHHPFTSPGDIESFMKYDANSPSLGGIYANAYDLVINGVEVGGGSIRIHDKTVQNKMFEVLGFTQEEAQKQFGFLLEAFEYGAPPHGGIAFGFDRLCSLFGGQESIRDFIAFPKNTSGRDVMIDSPSEVNPKQLEELSVAVAIKK